MSATAALDLKWALLANLPFGKDETRELLKRDPCVSVGESSIPGAGLGVFASRDIPIGSFVTEYCGKTLVGEEADALSAIDEQQLVWEDVDRLGLKSQDEHSLAMKEVKAKSASKARLLWRSYFILTYSLCRGIRRLMDLRRTMICCSGQVMVEGDRC